MLIRISSWSLIWLVIFISTAVPVHSIVTGGETTVDLPQDHHDSPPSPEPSSPQVTETVDKVAETRGAVDLLVDVTPPTKAERQDEVKPDIVQVKLSEGENNPKAGVTSNDGGKGGNVQKREDGDGETAQPIGTPESSQPITTNDAQHEAGKNQSGSSHTGKEGITPDTTNNSTATNTTTKSGEETKDGQLQKDERAVVDVINSTDEDEKSKGQESDHQPIAGLDLSAHDMPSFGEWKQDHADKNTKTSSVTNKVYEAQPAEKQKTPPTMPTGELRNYASSQCNAKIVSSNSEAENQQSVLNENRDDYMVQPCSASRKFLVIELCEAVLIRRIEIGNLELFSSTIQNFTVSISGNHGSKEKPGKDWQHIGTFRAKEKREIQSFNIDPLDIYTLFVKIEVLSHYGNEHYCPITIIRVHGYGVDDEDTDDDHEEDPTTTTPSPAVEEKAVQSTTAPPITANNTGDTDGSDVMEELVFPPIPKECLLCYESVDDIPPYCLNQVKSDNSNTTKTGMENPEASADIQKTEIEQVETKCDGEKEAVSDTKPSMISESNRPTPLPDVEDNTENTPKSSDSLPNEPESLNKNEAISNKVAEDTDLSKTKVKASPVPEAIDSSAGSNIVLATPSADVSTIDVDKPASNGDTKPQPAPTEEYLSSDAIVPKEEIDLILPSPPTLPEPPTAVNTQSEPPPTTPDVEEEPSIKEGEDVEGSMPQDLPPPGLRVGKKNLAISKVSNQVKDLKKSLNLTNRYLEEMSIKYKSQKDELQRALNTTMRSLQNTTMKLENLNKEYNALKDLTLKLSERVTSLESEIDSKESPMASLTAVVSAGVCILALLLISSCRKQHPQSLSREEIEDMLGKMPNYPVRGAIKRSESVSGIMNHAVENSAIQKIKRTQSHSAFKSSHVTDVGGVSDWEKNAANENQDSVDGDHPPSGITEYEGSIEIVSPAVWTSDGTYIQEVHVIYPGDHQNKSNAAVKAGKSKRRRRGNKGKASKDVNKAIPEYSDQSASSTRSHSPVLDQSQSWGKHDKQRSSRHSNGAIHTSITNSINRTNDLTNERPASAPLPPTNRSWIPNFFRHRSNS